MYFFHFFTSYLCSKCMIGVSVRECCARVDTVMTHAVAVLVAYSPPPSPG